MSFCSDLGSLVKTVAVAGSVACYMSDRAPMPLPSRAWSTGTLQASLAAVDAQHCKQEPAEDSDAEIKAPVSFRIYIYICVLSVL